jgi:hypothetical protein
VTQDPEAASGDGEHMGWKKLHVAPIEVEVEDKIEE